MQKDPQTRLHLHEWLTIGSFFAALLSIVYVTHYDKVPQARLTSPLPTCEVLVKGAVQREGVYRVSPEMSVSDLLSICEPLPEANLSKYKPNTRLKSGKTLLVPTQKGKKKPKT